jgi:hypothetical protein
MPTKAQPKVPSMYKKIVTILYSTIILLFIFTLIPLQTAVAIETTYNGLTVTWDTPLSDLVQANTEGDNSYYESAQLSPYGNEIKLHVKVPKEAIVTSDFPSRISVLATTGNSHRTVAHVEGGRIWNDQAKDYYADDLILDQTISVDVMNPAYTAFTIYLHAFPNEGLLGQAMFIHVSLAKSARHFMGNNPQLMGGRADNKCTKFDGSS